ncbi:MAG TPA: lasso RiPP family leader peptide-containing protein [Terriglobia bacterium]|nr:lasso RiPP family leader peptide-containing protein [Terriglobia bacterium]
MEERDLPKTKKPYEQPKITVLGDVEAITLGDELGEDLDAAFTTHSRGSKKPKKPKKNGFS